MKICKTDIFEAANGYERARIPGIICTDSGALIGYCELRCSESDWAVIDIGMKKSTDGGETWSERKILVSGEGENTVNNPVMISDGNEIHFLYCLNYRRVFYMKSIDEGESWSEAVELTEKIREQTGDFFWSCIATGPTHGIRTKAGRLIVPIWLAFNKADPKSHHPSVISTLYSDDRGLSWKTGSIFTRLNDPSEFCIAELSHGEIFVNIRHENEEKCRATGKLLLDNEISDVHFDEKLPDPVCCAGMCSDGEYLYFSNCADEKYRRRLTLKKISRDGKITDELLLCDIAGYSDITASADKKSIYVLHEYEKTLRCTEIRI